MSVQKTTPDTKKKKVKKEKGVKSKQGSKPGSKPGSKHGSKHGKKHGKHKNSKGQKMSKPSKHDPNKPKKKKKKIKSKASKKPLPTSDPGPGPFTSVPKKKEKKPVEAVAIDQGVGQGSGSLRVEKTQPSDDSAHRKQEKKEKEKREKEKKEKKATKSDGEKEEKKKKKMEEEKEKKEKKEEKKKEEDKPKEPKEPKVRPAAPGATPDKTPPTPEKKVSNLYNILGEISNTKSSLDTTPDTTPDDSKKKKKSAEITKTPEAKTPESVGPPMMEMKKEKSKKELKDVPKEGQLNGYDEEKLESERDNLDGPVVPKKDSSGPKKTKSLSFELQKTQSLSPVNFTVPTVSVPPSKQTSKPDPDPYNEIVMNTPPQPEVAQKAKDLEAQRSDLDQPLQEPEFVRNHGDTKVKKMDIKKVDLDLVSRTGMYLERFGMPAERKKAFDWIAYNRHDMRNKQAEFSKNMATALSDIGVNKKLLSRTIVYMKNQTRVITEAEMTKMLKEIELCKGETVSFSKVSFFLKTHCEAYKNKEVQ